MELHYSVLCCHCGAPIEPNPSSMCIQCLKQRVNIADGVDSDQNLLFCRQCERYSIAGDKFIPAALESPQLLGLCLKKIRGLKDCKILDARFLWQEPHSRRLKVRLVLQKEVMNGAIIEQEHVVNFVVTSTMCEECQYTYTNHTWNWVVQVRQKVVHKRTFLYLENEILGRRESFKIYDIVVQPDGIDFFFTEKSSCLRFMDFLHQKIPGRHSETEKLVSADVKSNTANKKHTILFEIAAICKDDLVVVPKKLKQYVGSLQKLCLVYKVNQRIHLVDPITGHTGSITAAQYFGCPFYAVRTRIQRQRCQVMYTDEDGAYIQTEADVELGEQHFSKTHLRPYLKEEGEVWVYDSQLIDFSEYELPKNYTCDQKYIIVSRAAKIDAVKLKKIREHKLLEEEQFKEDDVQAVAEMYEQDDMYKPELEEEEVIVDGQGYCPM